MRELGLTWVLRSQVAGRAEGKSVDRVGALVDSVAGAKRRDGADNGMLMRAVCPVLPQAFSAW